MSRAPFVVIDDKLYRWKDILELRRAQHAAAGAAEASQLALFATLHDDRRPPCERMASGRYLQPGLFEHEAAQARESRAFAGAGNRAGSGNREGRGCLLSLPPSRRGARRGR